MVCGGITVHNRTQLVIIDGNLNAEKYRDEILIPVLLPFLQRFVPGVILQPDNDCSHSVRIVQQFLQQQETDNLPWPAASPNLSPIEHMWNEMKR